jgi:hypothetical protein
MTFNKYLIAGTLAIFTVACDLDEIPKDSISPDNFFHSEADLEQYTNQFYLMEPSASDLYDETSNLIIDGLSQPSTIVGINRTVPSSGGGWSWGNLRHINYYLQNSYRCEKEAARNYYDGVAYFWRAYFYFEMLKKFGEVPWYDQVLASDDDELLAKSRDSRETVIQHIISDCDKAAELLEPGYVKSVYKISRDAALALKSRACLFEGTFRKYHAGLTFNPENLPYKELLTQAADAAYEIIKQDTYSPSKSGNTPYYSFFTSSSAVTSEIILARCYGGNFAHNADAYALIASKGQAGYTKALAFSYLMKDGTRFTDRDDYATMTFTEETVNRDPRMAQTIASQSSRYADGTDVTFNYTNTITGYPMLKFVTGPSSTSASTTDIPVFRIAEVYLNYAEAKAENGTLTQNDLDISVNKLRDRVDMPHMDMNAANANPDPFLTSELYGYINVDKGSNKGVILEIRRERSIELVSEGFRFADLCRWREGRLFAQPFYGPYIPGEGRYDMDGNGTIDFCVYTKRRNPSPGVTPLKIGEEIILSEGDKGYIVAYGQLTRSFNEDRDYLYPIPTNDRNLTGGVLTQNPGWDDGLTL